MWAQIKLLSHCGKWMIQKRSLEKSNCLVSIHVSDLTVWPHGCTSRHLYAKKNQETPIPSTSTHFFSEFHLKSEIPLAIQILLCTIAICYPIAWKLLFGMTVWDNAQLWRETSTFLQIFLHMLYHTIHE